MNSDIKDEIVNSFESSYGFIKNNRYSVVEIDNGYCKMEGLISEDSLNPYGIVHGGYIFGLADTAAGIAVSSIGRKAVTISSSIVYLRKVNGNKLIAIAKCLKMGSSIASCDVELFDELDNLVSKVLLEYHYISD